MAELEATAALGGVKGMAAKAQLEQMKSEDLLEQNRREVTSAANKRKAQRVRAPHLHQPSHLNIDSHLLRCVCAVVCVWLSVRCCVR